MSDMECRVCSAKANGFLYKISACRPCAAFFRRTVQMRIQYKCKKNRNCVVFHDQPFYRHCRMKKCLEMGMVTDDSELLSDFYFGINEDPNFSQLPECSTDSNEDDIYSPMACFGNHQEFEGIIKQKISKILKKEYEPPSLPYKLNLCQQSMRALEKHDSNYNQELKPPRELVFSVEEMEEFFAGIFKIFISIAEFFSNIEPFAKLPFADKVEIYKRKGTSFVDIYFCAKTVKMLGRDVNDSKIAFFDGHVLDIANSKMDLSTVCNAKDADMKDLMLGTYVQIDEILMKPFKRYNPDDFEVHYMHMKSLWNLEEIDEISKETLALSQSLQGQLDEELSYYYKYELKLENVANRIYKIQNLLAAVDKVFEIRESDKQMWKMFDIFKFDVWIDDVPS